jgi:hypothetical protein
MLEHCPQNFEAVQRTPPKARAIPTHRELPGNSDNWKNGVTNVAVPGGVLRSTASPQVLHEEGFGSDAPADGLLNHDCLAGKEGGSIGIKNMPSAQMAPTLDGVTEFSQDGHQQPAKAIGPDNVLKEAETRGDIFEDLTSFEVLKTVSANVSGAVMAVPRAILTAVLRAYYLSQAIRRDDICVLDDDAHAYYDYAYYDSLCVGRGNQIPRWVPGSVLTFYVDSPSFPTIDYAAHATTSIVIAAAKWNNLCGGNVPKFEQVHEISAAVFQLKYADKPFNGNAAFAHAFCPGASPTVSVYASSFQNKYRDSLVNIFCHELGHVLGARHEFAPEDEHERKLPSMVLGERNSASVMNNPDHPSKLEIRESDVSGMKEFYDLKDSYYNGSLIVDHDPTLGSKSSASVDETAGSRLASPKRVRSLGIVTTKMTMTMLISVTLVLGVIAMGTRIVFWIGYMNLEPISPVLFPSQHKH